MNILREKTVTKTYNKLSKLPLGTITAQGWLREQLLRNKEGMGGHLDELEPDFIGTPFINYSAYKRLPFMEQDDDRTHAAGWSGELSGYYWMGLIQLAFTLNDEELIAKATKWVEGVLKNQEADGYLGCYPPGITDRMHDYNAVGSNMCYTALLSFYEATGRQDILDAVYRGLLWYCENWKDNKTDYAGNCIIEMMIVGFAYTGDERLVQFCKDYLDWLEEHSTWQNKVSQYLSDKLPYSSMHAVAYGGAVKNPALVYCATGEKRLLDASCNGLKKALERIVQPTGGPSSNGEFLSPKGSVNETEYCNFTAYNQAYSWMAIASGEAIWGDHIERALFNGAQGARKKDERAIAYFTAPNQMRANRESCIYGDWSEYGVYAPNYFVACCPTMSVRIIPEFVRSMALKDENGELHLLCYGPATVNAPKLSFTMDTLYPFRETVALQITRAEDAALHLRIPEWCKAPAALVNGKETALTLHETGFAKLEAALNAGDTVELKFPMTVSVSRLDDSASASKFPIVIERGPLVYAIPIPVEWTPYAGRPVTPLPEGWYWYDGSMKMTPEDVAGDNGYFRFLYGGPWNKAIDERITTDQIRVVERENTGYVWEDPPVVLEVPLYHAKYCYTLLSPKMSEAWEVPVAVEGEAAPVTMVPHGCTNLRITFLPRADV